MENCNTCFLCGFNTSLPKLEASSIFPNYLSRFLLEENLIDSAECPRNMCKNCSTLNDQLVDLSLQLKQIRRKVIIIFLRKEEPKVGVDGEDQTSNEKPLNCVICGKQFRSLKGYNNHMKNHEIKDENRETFCHKCKRLFNTKRQYARHQYTVHSVLVPTFCEVCNIKFEFEKSLAKHNQKVHSHKVVCKLCDKEFFTSANLAVHLRNIHPDSLHNSTFICEFCPRLFKSTEKLKQHQKGHEGLNYSCNICKKCFKWDSSLNSHMQAAHDKSGPSFKCPECGKSLKDKNNYKKHLFTHTDAKPYYCNICGKGFIRKDLLKKHNIKCSVINYTSQQLTHQKTVNTYKSKVNDLK